MLTWCGAGPAAAPSLNLIDSTTVSSASFNPNNAWVKCNNFNLDPSNTGHIANLWSNVPGTGFSINSGSDEQAHCFCGKSTPATTTTQFTLQLNAAKPVKTIITTNVPNHVATFSMEFKLGAGGTWTNLCSSCNAGTNDFSGATDSVSITLDHIRITFQANSNFALCEIWAYSFKNYVPVATSYNFYYVSSPTNLMKTGSVGTSYLSTSKMIGTNDAYPQYTTVNAHTCNSVDNNVNPKGNSYLVVTLNSYLEIKEIYNMGTLAEETRYYLGDPSDTQLVGKTAAQINTLITGSYASDIATYPNVKYIDKSKGVDSFECIDTECTTFATNQIIISNKPKDNKFQTCGFAIMAKKPDCLTSNSNFTIQCSHSLLQAISTQPTAMSVGVGATLTSTSTFIFNDNLSVQCGGTGCESYKSTSLSCIKCSACTNPGSCTGGASCVYAAATFGNSFNAAKNLVLSPTLAADAGQYQCKIVGSLGSQTQTSNMFQVTICGACSATTLSLGASPTVPSFPGSVSVGDTGVQSTFSAFTNSVQTCSGIACGTVSYATTCSLSTGGPYTTPSTWSASIPTPTATATTVTLTVKAQTAVVHGQIFYCIVTGTHSISSQTLSTQEFTIQFDICLNPAQSCTYNTIWSQPVTPPWVPPADITVYTDGIAVTTSFVYTNWQDFYTLKCGTQVCGPLTYNFQLSPGGTAFPPSLSTTTINSSTQTITFSVATTNTADANTYLVQIAGTMNTAGIWAGPGPTSIWQAFQVKIVNPCGPPPLCEDTKMLPTTSTQNNMPGLVDNVAVLQTFTAFQDYVSKQCSVTCNGMTYKLMYASNHSGVPLDLATVQPSSPPKVQLQTSNFAYSGTTSVYIQAVFNPIPQYGAGSVTTSNGNTFDLVVDACNSCKATYLIAYSGSSIQPTSYSIGVENTPGSTLFSTFSNMAAFKCGVQLQCGTPTYSLVCVSGCPAGSSPPFLHNITPDVSGKMKLTSQTTDPNLAKIYTVYVQASLDLSSFGNSTPSIQKTNNFQITIDACSPLPCAYNQINMPVTTGTLNYLPSTQLIKCNGTLTSSYFSEYTDTVSTRCSSGVYSNLCGPKQYSIEISPTGTPVPITVSISYDSTNQVWNFTQSTTDCSLVNDYQVQIHSKFATPTISISDNTLYTFTQSVIYPNPCNPLLCTSNQIFAQDSSLGLGDIYPSDFSIWVNNTLNQTNFTNFRDYKSDYCVGQPGGFLNGTTVTSFTYPVCSRPTYEVYLASNNQPLSSIIGAANIFWLYPGGTAVSLQIQTTQKILAGSHSIYIKGTIGSQSVNSKNFTLTVLDPCNPYNCSLTQFYYDTTGVKPQNISVIVGGGQTTSTQALWFDSVSVQCGASIYRPLCGLPTFTLIQLDGSVVPFSYDVVISSKNTQVQIQSTNINLIGNNYTVILLGYQIDSNGNKFATGNSSSFIVQIVAPTATVQSNSSQNSLKMPQFSSFPSDYTFTVNQTYDPVQETAVAIKQNGTISQIKVNVGSALNFVSYSISGSVVNFIIDPTLQIYPSTFPIIVSATDSLGQTVNKQFSITMKAPAVVVQLKPTLAQQQAQLIPNITNQTLDDSQPKLSAWIQSISELGMMEIWFSSPVIPVSDVTIITAKEYLMTMEQNSLEADQIKDFSWTVTKSTPQKLYVQLVFKNPLAVSQGKTPDKVNVWILSSSLMIQDQWSLYKTWQDTTQTNSEVTSQDNSSNTQLNKATQNKQQNFLAYSKNPLYYELQGVLPKQLQNAQAVDLLQQNLNNANFIVQVSFWVPFILQIGLPETLEKTWLSFGSLQSINMMAQLDLQTPHNVQKVAQSLQKTANSQFLDNSNLYQWLRELASDKKPSNLTKSNETKTKGATKSAQKRNLQQIQSSEFQISQFNDFGSTDKVLECSSQLFVQMFFIVMLAFVGILISYSVLPLLPLKVGVVFNQIKQRIYWSLPLRLLSQQYLQVTLGVFLNLKFQKFTDSQEQKTNMAISVLLLLFYSIGYPIWMVIFIRRNWFKAHDPIFKAKFNSLYLKVDVRKYYGLFLLATTLLRRFLFAFTAVSINFNIIQLTMIMYIQQIMTQYVLIVSPMEDNFSNQTLIFNEVVVSLLCINLYMFTDYVPDPVIRYQLGWFFAYTVYFVFLVTMCVWLYDFIQMIRFQLKVLYFKYQMSKRKRSVKGHNKIVDVIGNQKDAERNEAYKRKPVVQVQNELESIESMGSLEVSQSQDNLDGVSLNLNKITIATRKKEFEMQMHKLKMKNEKIVDENVVVKKLLDATFALPEKKEEIIQQPSDSNYDDYFKGLIPPPENNLGEQKVIQKLQKQSDWPISPKHANVVAAKNTISNQVDKNDRWEWENEVASDASEWNALPDDYDQIKSINLSDSQVGENKKQSKQMNHVGKLPVKIKRNNSIQSDVWISMNQDWDIGQDQQTQNVDYQSKPDLVFNIKAKRQAWSRKNLNENGDEFFGNL